MSYLLLTVNIIIIFGIFCDILIITKLVGLRKDIGRFGWHLVSIFSSMVISAAMSIWAFIDVRHIVFPGSFLAKRAIGGLVVASAIIAYYFYLSTLKKEDVTVKEPDVEKSADIQENSK